MSLLNVNLKSGTSTSNRHPGKDGRRSASRRNLTEFFYRDLNLIKSFSGSAGKLMERAHWKCISLRKFTALRVASFNSSFQYVKYKYIIIHCVAGDRLVIIKSKSIKNCFLSSF